MASERRDRKKARAADSYVVEDPVTGQKYAVSKAEMIERLKIYGEIVRQIKEQDDKKRS